MGSDLCADVKQDQKLFQRQEDQGITNNNNLALVRTGLPSKRIAFNLNQIPDGKKKEEYLNQMQKRIEDFLSLERKKEKPYKINRKPVSQNQLKDPYYIHCLSNIYVGEWVYHKGLDDHVPGGIGRMYTAQNIMEGEFYTHYQQEDAYFFQHNEQMKPQDSQAQSQNIFGQPIQNNIQQSVKKAQKSLKNNQSEYRQNSLEISVFLNGEGRIFNRTQQQRGTFERGKLVGRGHCRYRVEDGFYEYDGEFKEGKRHGKGNEKYKLTLYEGEYEEDMKHGYGVLTMKIGNVYDQQRLEEEQKIAVQDKARNSEEIIKTVRDYIKVRKQFEQHLAQLLSEYKWIPPKYKSRSFLDNEYFLIERHRRSKFLEHYKGKFSSNKFNGEGAYYWFNGKCYDGNWKDDQMHGIGEFYWPSGAYYRGQYSQDNKHGKGQMIWSLGKRYRGSWAYSMRHGYGQLIQITSNQPIEQSNFRDSKGMTNRQSKGVKETKVIVETGRQGQASARFERKYKLRVKGALWKKDQEEKVYFDIEQDIGDARLYQIQTQEKQMIAFIKDLKIR